MAPCQQVITEPQPAQAIAIGEEEFQLKSQINRRLSDRVSYNPVPTCKASSLAGGSAPVEHGAAQQRMDPEEGRRQIPAASRCPWVALLDTDQPQAGIRA